MTLDKDTLKMVDAQADKRGMSRNEWLAWATEQAIKASVGQFALSGLATDRLNQLIDTLYQQQQAFNNMNNTVYSLIHMLNNLISGESFLNDEDQDAHEEN